ncbi:MAG: folylpolyglutamate synthase/dihydrofolate synthase family protein [Pirellulaceae bacterium]|nr:folylpolyglutamate synthase/dihydrofolate synthase family protein [Pirellulaceae bacterium]
MESYQAAIEYLYDRINYERSTDQAYNQNNYRLSRMERLLVELGNPQQAAPVIHVAGSKGKGSVAWLTAECLRESGYRTGLYTSPHLLRLEERFVINGQAVDPAQFIRAVDAVKPAAHNIAEQGHGHPTFFELTTAMAWWLFREQAVDVNIIEVGLGGRLDSTNVCWPALSVITSISYDHQQQLGNTLAEIAGEKAGIIKPGVPVVSGATHPEASETISRIAKERGCKLRLLGVDFISSRPKPEASAYGSREMRMSYHPDPTLWPSGTHRTSLKLRLLGKHQLANAAVVLAGLDILREHGWDIEESAIEAGLATTQVPGRVEVVSEGPTTIIDTAHNEASIEALIDTLDENFPDRKRIVVFSASREKNSEAMLNRLMLSCQELVLTQFHINPRAQPTQTLKAIADNIEKASPGQPIAKIRVVEDSLAALEVAQKMADQKDLIVITGSFFLAAELMEKFERPEGTERTNGT